MFKKIVSNLPFSPSLMNELGFYAKRLRQEEVTRKLGLILTAVALVIQSFVVFSPPESTNAASSSDLIYGGIYSKSQLMSAWDNNTQGYRELLQHIGVTRENLANTYEGEINTRTNGKDNGWLSWGRISRGGSQWNETAMNVGNQTIYVVSLAAFDTGSNRNGGGSYYPSFIGTNSKGEQFIISKACANIAMKTRPKTDKKIKVCNVSTREIITIKESEFKKSNHSKSLSDCDAKPIEVCDLAGQKMITIDERDFDSRKHSKNPADCQPKPTPVATCSSLVVSKLSRTEVEFKASANTANGASIKSYTYIIKNQDGKEVLRKTVASVATSDSLKHTIEKDGAYTVEVVVGTSLGDKTAQACQGGFVIEPIARCPLNPALPINDPNCQSCPGDPTLWVKDDQCAAKIVRTKKARNLTTNQDATTDLARASDRIEYTITVKNESNDTAEYDNVTDNIKDVLEYASLYDRGGGALDEQTKDLSWGKISLAPGEQQERSYVVQVASIISPRSQGASDPTSYDCRMVNTFGTTLEVQIDCPAPKIIEQVVVAELPRTGPTANLLIGGSVLAIVAFLYFRSRQLNQEVRLVRREMTAGTL